MANMYYLKQIPLSSQIKKYIRRILFWKNLFCPECRSQKIVKEFTYATVLYTIFIVI